MKKRLITIILSVFFTLSIFATASNAAGTLKVLPTTVDTPRAGCTFLGIEGKYITQIQEALDRINEIRKEACAEGVANPATNKPLTKSDYVPIQWSAGLEYIARIRAAEASLTMDHKRTNGEEIWFSSPNGTSSFAEVIAWNFGETMTDGIEQWYGEKYDWVNKTGRVTGHYTSLINPQYRYVGLGTFCSRSTKYYNTTAGEFCFSDSDSSRGSSTGTIIQTLEVTNGNISYEINCPDKISNSDKVSVTATVSFTDYWGSPLTTKGLVLLDDAANKIKWSSSNGNIIVSNGIITIKSCEKADITAELPNGKKITKSVSAEHSYKSAVTKAATCTENGIKTFTCSVCKTSYTEPIKATGHTYSSEWTTDKAATCTSEGSKSHHCTVCGAKSGITTIPKTQHNFGDYVVKQQPTETAEGIEERTCSSCGAKEQRTIAKLSSSGTSSSSSTSSQPSNSDSSNDDGSSSSSVASESTESEPTDYSDPSSESGSVSVTSSIVQTSGNLDSPSGSSDQGMSDSSQNGSNTDNGNARLIIGIALISALLVGIVAVILVLVKEKKNRNLH